MAHLSPFRALRPAPSAASRVASVPYDVVSTAEARALAADNPLSFPILPDHDLPVLPKYNATADYAKKEATKKIEVSPAFDSVPGPKSAHTILAGSWDFKAMPLDKPPSFALMAKAGLIGVSALCFGMELRRFDVRSSLEK